MKILFELAALTLERGGFYLLLMKALKKKALEECSNYVLVSHLILQMGFSEWLLVLLLATQGEINKTPGQKASCLK